MKKSIFKVMTDPRGFIKSLVSKNISKVPLYIVWVIGMVYLMRQGAGFQLSFRFSYGWIVLAAAILAIPFGYGILYLFSILLYWSGKLFKGKANFKDLVLAVGYGRVPEIFVLISWLLIVLLLGQATFTQVYILNGLPNFLTVLLYTQLFFYIWEFVICLHTIGEVQGFSAWMALWNYILGGALLMVVAFFLEFAAASIFSLNTDGAKSSISLILGLIK
jgi:hypothetical protein